MACNATRIELSNSAATTVQITVSSWSEGDDELSVTLEVDGLAIDETATTSSGVATMTISAVSAGNLSLWDGTIQVGTNRSVLAEVLVVETNIAQGIGLSIDDTLVTYCAPTGGGGGGDPADATIPGLSSTAFLFADNTGYVEGATAAFIRTDPLNSVYPKQTPIVFGGDLSGTDYSDRVVNGELGARFYVPSYQNLFANFTRKETGTLNVVDMTRLYTSLGPLANISVAFNSGVCIETLTTPHRSADSGLGLDPINYNYVRVMRSHEAQACSAAIDAIATNGIDGGTF